MRLRCTRRFDCVCGRSAYAFALVGARAGAATCDGALDKGRDFSFAALELELEVPLPTTACSIKVPALLLSFVALSLAACIWVKAFFASFGKRLRMRTV